MTTITTAEIITSLSDTPQAKDDLYTVAALAGLGVLSEDGGTVTLDVMLNDLGGRAKTLYSLDDGIENEGLATSADLLTRDIVGADNSSKFGALIEFTADGKVTYSMTPASTTHFQSLAAGQVGLDTFTYTIRLGNGTLSWATVTVEIVGTNDAPKITSAAQSGSITEDGTQTANGTVTSSDVDNGATATYSGDASGTYGSFAVTASTGVWTYTLANAAAQSLAAGQTVTETYIVTVTDDQGATATQNVVITITGTNDAPVITSTAQSGSVTEDTTLTATGTVASSDVDNSATATYSGNASSSHGSFAVVASTGVWTYTLNNAAAQHLAATETMTETFTVTVSDGLGGTATQDVVITITGTNDAPTILASAPSNALVEQGGAVAGTATSVVNLVKADIDGTVTYDTTGWAQLSATTFQKAGVYGSATLDTTTNLLTYSLDNANAATNALNTGTTVQDSFNVNVVDAFGASASAPVAFSIQGTNDGLALRVDFENLKLSGQAEIIDGYQGFNWDVPNGLNLYEMDGDAYGGSNGYNLAGTSIAFTPYAYQPVTITRSDKGDFDFEGVELTSAWDSSQAVTLRGYLDGILVGSASATIYNTQVTAVDVNWGAIDVLIIGNSGSQLVLDNFDFIIL